ncbi:MAG TPA: HEAT repeat domain-containing protein [Anaerolineales bacterium]|nr:HEAT repeat domain-containing protein [Anaerolineales bacterium]HNB34835.1 HEAT repeat domain-containing protein [Anaerolineales bacterium]HNC07275.1 HEAT repeat domain-containing protein [Anaerolineales bacterium]
MFEKIKIATIEELMVLWNNTASDIDVTQDSMCEDVANALSQIRPEGINFLKSFAYSKDRNKRRWAIYFLASKEIADAEVKKYLLDLASSDDESCIITALLGFIRIGYFPLENTVVINLMDHKDERLAATAMVYLSNAHPKETVNILIDGFRSANPRKREYACDEVGDRMIHELKEYLLEATKDSDGYVRQAATINLEFFT